MREFRVIVIQKSGTGFEVNLRREDAFDDETLASELWKLISYGIKSGDHFFRMGNYIVSLNDIANIKVIEIDA